MFPGGEVKSAEAPEPETCNLPKTDNVIYPPDSVNPSDPFFGDKIGVIPSQKHLAKQIVARLIPKAKAAAENCLVSIRITLQERIPQYDNQGMFKGWTYKPVQGGSKVAVQNVADPKEVYTIAAPGPAVVFHLKPNTQYQFYRWRALDAGYTPVIGYHYTKPNQQLPSGRVVKFTTGTSYAEMKVFDRHAFYRLRTPYAARPAGYYPISSRDFNKQFEDYAKRLGAQTSNLWIYPLHDERFVETALYRHDPKLDGKTINSLMNIIRTYGFSTGFTIEQKVYDLGILRAQYPQYAEYFDFIQQVEEGANWPSVREVRSTLRGAIWNMYKDNKSYPYPPPPSLNYANRGLIGIFFSYPNDGWKNKQSLRKADALFLHYYVLPQRYEKNAGSSQWQPDEQQILADIFNGIRVMKKDDIPLKQTYDEAAFTNLPLSISEVAGAVIVKKIAVPVVNFFGKTVIKSSVRFIAAKSNPLVRELKEFIADEAGEYRPHNDKVAQAIVKAIDGANKRTPDWYNLAGLMLPRTLSKETRDFLKPAIRDTFEGMLRSGEFTQKEVSDLAKQVSLKPEEIDVVLNGTTRDPGLLQEIIVHRFVVNKVVRQHGKQTFYTKLDVIDLKTTPKSKVPMEDPPGARVLYRGIRATEENGGQWLPPQLADPVYQAYMDDLINRIEKESYYQMIIREKDQHFSPDYGAAIGYASFDMEKLLKNKDPGIVVRIVIPEPYLKGLSYGTEGYLDIPRTWFSEPLGPQTKPIADEMIRKVLNNIPDQH